MYYKNSDYLNFENVGLTLQEMFNHDKWIKLLNVCNTVKDLVFIFDNDYQTADDCCLNKNGIINAISKLTNVTEISIDINQTVVCTKIAQLKKFYQLP